ncbi:hypothetical protein TWF706_003210 [Orbilia oligospora]|nr:hypothetical protein TWF103_000936 [Orbilia oligospora]KAF3106697.1 hypothetical protein TWF706_003210 [Orbilia oligospora]
MHIRFHPNHAKLTPPDLRHKNPNRARVSPFFLPREPYFPRHKKPHTLIYLKIWMVFPLAQRVGWVEISAYSPDKRLKSRFSKRPDCATVSQLALP